MRDRAETGGGLSQIFRAFLQNERGLKRFLSRYFSRTQDIDDIAQETFLRAFAAEADRDVLKPRAFLYRIARNLALNERAKRSHSTTASMEDFPDPSVLGSEDQVRGEDLIEDRQKMAIFAEAVSALPPQCRRVFMLRKVHGLSQQAVAERLGISPSTVEKHVASGLLKCSEYLRLRGYEVSGRDGTKTNAPCVPAGSEQQAEPMRARGGSKTDV